MGVEIATGFGETTLGAAPGVPPVLTPPEWPAGSSQEVGWNAYANHAGGYLYRLAPANGPLTEEVAASVTPRARTRCSGALSAPADVLVLLHARRSTRCRWSS